MRSSALFAVLGLLACGEADILSHIPPEPDAGHADDALVVDPPPAPDAGSPRDAADPVTPECDPATHQPTPCRSGECFGAVLCIAGALHCVAPACETPPDPDECDGPDYVFIHDRSGSMQGIMPKVQAITSSLARHRERNLFFIDLPRQFGPEEAGPSAGCYHSSQPWPIPPCLFPGPTIELLTADYWGSHEPTMDVLTQLPSLVQWTPGRAKHLFMFADERPQGRYLARDAIARLVPAGVRAHLWVNLRLDPADVEQYRRVAEATGGSLHGLDEDAFDPCP